ncbi:hydrogenase formation protein HypD [Desulfobaculum bizertense]|uniref:Hydrogenase expression/formation protein HypD n=1 Tax=Desulfobaculum bizertense DSM 18034 TaxID=1121442 RepID=A0A1T4W7W9_9BACT|nr:hydrogenase formation protein HypD [Desulfobaculum bizertense]SKA73095.1 hydrogenase expression/formation protein HypD [Desulfobaculum bizertense DSM 18034]
MNMLKSFSDPRLCRSLLDKIHEELHDELRFMEVCGSHTVSIFRSGLHSLLPKNIIHLSGPGCPVCVTHESEVGMYLDLAAREDVIVATFGDLMRVPGPEGRNLKTAQAEGSRIKVVYSPFDALELARQNPDAKVVFLGIGFETTAPVVAATIHMAEQQGLKNFFVLSFHKLVPPALNALMSDPEIKVNALIIPGHVAVVVGTHPYDFLPQKFQLPAVVTGFDPLDILQSLLELVRQHNEGRAAVVNHYTRAVQENGNPRAVEFMEKVFEPTDALWRGIGLLPMSGLKIAPAYEAFDAKKVLGLELHEEKPIPGCRCGEVLKGKLAPNKCPLFGKVCTPASPVGPCMVSTEGSCAAYFKYNTEL